MYKKYALMLVMLLGMSVSAVAQEGNKQFVLGNTQIIPMQSKSTGRAHELVVVLPDGYAANPTKKYPVLYFLDAYWDTPLVAASYSNLIYDNQVPEMILVGMSYPTGANYGQERSIDYAVKADLFLDFIKKEAAPLIESKYRAEQTGRVLSGSSLGGLFTMSTAYKDPGFFSAYIAISPAVLADNNGIARMDEAFAKTNKSFKARLFVSYGSEEFPAFRDPIIALQKQLAGRKYEGFEVLNYGMEGIDHASVKGEGYVRGLTWVMKPKKPAGPSGLTKGFTGAN